MKIKLFENDTICDKAKEILSDYVEYTLSPTDTDIIWTGLTPITTDKIVFCPCTGVDHIKSPKIIHLNDKWKRKEGRMITSTAEHTLSLILQLAKMKRMQLKGKKIGIIGNGRIGTHIFRYSLALNLDVTFNDTKERGGSVYPNTPLNKLLKESDIITLHVPLNDETRGLICAKEFSMMKRGALLVNTSRPEIVHYSSLIEALNNGLGGYADDFKNEREIKYPYWVNMNIIQTNHIGGNCIEARELTDIYIAEQVVNYIKEMSNEHRND